jgi:creatinine amidohydrolase
MSRWYGDALPKLLHLLQEEHPEYDLHAGEWETALVLLRAPELVDRKALDALPPNWETRNISERRAYCGDPRRATPKTGERLYAALGGFVAEEGASLLRS